MPKKNETISYINNELKKKADSRGVSVIKEQSKILKTNLNKIKLQDAKVLR